MKFYKRDPNAALAGMADLTLQERGAYNTILDLLYSRDGILPDDDEMIRRTMGCHGNEWRSVKTKLIDKKKLWIEDGYLKANRVDSVLKEAGNFSETQRIRAGKRWEKEGISPSNPKKREQIQPQENAKAGIANIAIATATPIAKVVTSDLRWTSKISQALGYDITNLEPPKPLRFVTTGQELIAAGVDVELDLVPVIAEKRQKGAIPPNLKSLNWFRDAAIERKNARELLAQVADEIANAPFEDATEKGWNDRLRAWCDCGSWKPAYGPKPRSGECRAPAAILARWTRAWNDQGGHPAGAFPVDPNGRWTEWGRLRDLRNNPDCDYGDGPLPGANVVPLRRA